MPRLHPAPPLTTSDWINTPRPLALDDFHGRVLLIEAFQMLCPGCVLQGLPQAQRVRAAFPTSDLAVIGLHTVFEHHAAQGTRVALEAFAHEYRLTFPIGIDEQSLSGGIPRTMAAYAMQGTPTLILIDRQGHKRMQRFGHIDDLALGAAIQTLIGERADDTAPVADPDAIACGPEGCRLPVTA